MIVDGELVEVGDVMLVVLVSVVVLAFEENILVAAVDVRVSVVGVDHATTISCLNFCTGKAFLATAVLIVDTAAVLALVVVTFDTTRYFTRLDAIAASGDLSSSDTGERETEVEEV